MAAPREVYAAPDGTLKIEPLQELSQSKDFSEAILDIPTLSIESIGSFSTQFFDLPPLTNTYTMSFTISQSDASSFGILFRTNSDLQGFALRFVPTAGNTYTTTLSISPAPLDDFWADQYKLYLPREVDGPDVVRHESLQIEKPVQIFVLGETLEVFVGGRAMSYRIPQISDEQSKANGHANGANGNGHNGHNGHVEQETGKVHELGVFVQDGNAQLSGLVVREANAPVFAQSV